MNHLAFFAVALLASVAASTFLAAVAVLAIDLQRGKRAIRGGVLLAGAAGIGLLAVGIQAPASFDLVDASIKDVALTVFESVAAVILGSIAAFALVLSSTGIPTSGTWIARTAILAGAASVAVVFTLTWDDSEATEVLGTPRPGTGAPLASSYAQPDPRADQREVRMVQDGFDVEGIANVGFPTALAFGPDGDLFITSLDGNVYSLRRSTDYRELAVVAGDFSQPQGIAFAGERMFVSDLGRITALTDSTGDGSYDAREIIADDLPWVDTQHSNNGIAIRNGKELFVAIGAPEAVFMDPVGDGYVWSRDHGENFDKGDPISEMAGTLLRFDLETGEREIFAIGLRNPYAIGISQTGDLFVTDSGEGVNLRIPGGDELNHVVEGGHYGHPDTHGYPAPGDDSASPVTIWRAHATPTGVAIYDGASFPSLYRDTAFVAIFQASRFTVSVGEGAAGAELWEGQKISHVALRPIPEEPGYAGEVTDFLVGLQGPTGVAVGPDGDLFVADLSGTTYFAVEEYNVPLTGPGAIYRVTYTGG